MNQAEKRKLDTQLMVMGLKRLNDPELVPQMARLIKDHDFFMGLLNECDQEKRYEMYHAITPHLSFEAWPLETYIAKLKERAAAIESWSKPITVGEDQFQQVTPDQATGVVIDMTCYKCPRTASFYGETPLSAVILARQDGWVRERGTNKEVCPKCECVDRGERKKCPSCTRRHYPPDCRMIAKPKEKPEREKVIIQ